MLKITTDTSSLGYNRYHTLGVYHHDINTITLNIPVIKRAGKEKWRQLAVVTFAHEFTHYLQRLFGHDFEKDNPYTRYVAELQAAKVDKFVLKLLKVEAAVEMEVYAEESAMSSIQGLTRYYLQQAPAKNNILDEEVLDKIENQ